MDDSRDAVYDFLQNVSAGHVTNSLWVRFPILSSGFIARRAAIAKPARAPARSEGQHGGGTGKAHRSILKFDEIEGQEPSGSDGSPRPLPLHGLL